MFNGKGSVQNVRMEIMFASLSKKNYWQMETWLKQEELQEVCSTATEDVDRQKKGVLYELL